MMFFRAVVSIHARHATGDTAQRGMDWTLKVFQFTPVMRRATGVKEYSAGAAWFQFTPVMRRATYHVCHWAMSYVSIHARHATGDMTNIVAELVEAGFNSRPSCDGRRYWSSFYSWACNVSIHARHATGDRSS